MTDASAGNTYRSLTVEETRRMRDVTIEECAKVAENAKRGWTPKFIAFAIRALKEK